jgi:hypothetical protein
MILVKPLSTTRSGMCASELMGAQGRRILSLAMIQGDKHVSLARLCPAGD